MTSRGGTIKRLPSATPEGGGGEFQPGRAAEARAEKAAAKGEHRDYQRLCDEAHALGIPTSLDDSRSPKTVQGLRDEIRNATAVHPHRRAGILAEVATRLDRVAAEVAELSGNVEDMVRDAGLPPNPDFNPKPVAA